MYVGAGRQFQTTISNQIYNLDALDIACRFETKRILWDVDEPYVSIFPFASLNIFYINCTTDSSLSTTMRQILYPKVISTNTPSNWLVLSQADESKKVLREIAP
jgi:hypothetical protein